MIEIGHRSSWREGHGPLSSYNSLCETFFRIKQDWFIVSVCACLLTAAAVKQQHLYLDGDNLLHFVTLNIFLGFFPLREFYSQKPISLPVVSILIFLLSFCIFHGQRDFPGAPQSVWFLFHTYVLAEDVTELFVAATGHPAALGCALRALATALSSS